MSIDYSVTGSGVATITLDRPERLNALDEQMTADLLASAERAAGDPAVRAVVLTGAGRGFCSGGDSSAPSTVSFGSLEEEIAWTRRHTEVSHLLASMEKVTIAAVNGPCAGVGLSFAAACDIRLAADSAVFVTAYRGAGLPGDGGIAWTLSRLIGTGRARYQLLMSPRIDAQTAFTVGLIDQVVPRDELTTAAATLAAEMAALPPQLIKAMKADFVDAARLDLADYLDVETRRHVLCRHC